MSRAPGPSAQIPPWEGAAAERARFEVSYYEDPAFWSRGMVEDPSNLRRLEATAERLPDGATSLLDVGCGNGVFARLVKARFPAIHVTCADRSAAALRHVQADDKRQCEMSSLPFADRSFDCVTCLEVIEHLTCADYQAALAELARVARDTIIVTVPYNEAIEKNTDTCPQCRTTFNRDLHLRSFDQATLDGLLDDFGFRKVETVIPVVDTHYLGFRTFYKLKRRVAGVPDRSQLFSSPLCPVCGYAPRSAPTVPATPPPLPGTLSKKESRLKVLAKRFWPKQTTPGYWILGRFVRLAG